MRDSSMPSNAASEASQHRPLCCVKRGISGCNMHDFPLWPFRSPNPPGRPTKLHISEKYNNKCKNNTEIAQLIIFRSPRYKRRLKFDQTTKIKKTRHNRVERWGKTLKLPHIRINHIKSMRSLHKHTIGPGGFKTDGNY